MRDACGGPDRRVAAADARRGFPRRCPGAGSWSVRLMSPLRGADSPRPFDDLPAVSGRRVGSLPRERKRWQVPASTPRRPGPRGAAAQAGAKPRALGSPFLLPFARRPF